MSSKYRSKKKGAKSVPRKLGTVVFQYNCQCHDVRANKKPCVIDFDTPFEDRNKLEHSLGTWRCAVTNTSCKVSRTRKKAEETAEQEAA